MAFSRHQAFIDYRSVEDTERRALDSAGGREPNPSLIIDPLRILKAGDRRRSTRISAAFIDYRSVEDTESLSHPAEPAAALYLH